MYTRSWIFLTNPFATCTFRNFSKALQISNYLDASLNATKADAAILVLYNYYHPLHTSYVNAYNTWLAQKGTQKGSTATLAQLLAQSKDLVNNWDLSISVALGLNSAAHMALFPQGYAPFNQGKQANRISAFKALGNNLASYTALATTKTAVDNYYNSLVAANTTQKGSKTTKNTYSDALEAQRISICNGQMYVYGGLVQKYVTNLDLVGNFFDLKAIRTGGQSVFVNKVKANSTRLVLQHTARQDEVIRLKNTGTVPLTFFLSASAEGNKEGTEIVVAPLSEQTHPYLDFSAPDSSFLLVSNTSPTVVGSYEVELL